ncbi:MAG: class I SAM-dependent DNA methyltransferase, partial [Campylobacterales bacterium]
MPIRPFIKKPRAFISPLLSKQSIDKESFERFRLAISTYIDNLKAEYATSQSEPNIVTNALKPFFEALGYTSATHSQKGHSGIDLILKNSDEKPGVIIEAKKEGSREFITKDSLNKRALHEAVLYFMRERDRGNLALYHIIITDFYQFYLFDAKDFDRLFWQNKQIKKLYTNYKDPSILGDGTSFFYEGLQRELERTKADLIDDLEIECAYFNLKEYESLDEKKSIALYKLLSSDTLLKEFNPNDANSLNREFYSELLHILGLEEVKESGKKRIKRSKTQEGGSLYENILDKLITYGKLDPKADEELKLDSVLSLLVIWLNRILFLKLVESQVIIWSDGESKKFLNSKKIAGYDELENLFFKVLAKKPSERSEPLRSKFVDVPYLNSSLFSISKEEQELLYISNLDPNKELSYYNKTILKDVDGKKRKGSTNPLFYLFEFLDAYDFSSEGSEELQSESKSLINAAVLGLIFEKLNGYKDGSFYTPSFITMYMAKQSVEKALIEKFNAKKGWSATSITDIYNNIGKNIEDKKEANEIINSLLVCDPAVGSGHFLVSTLNHLIYIKDKLDILLDSEGKRIRDYDIEIVNDELIIKDEDGELFEYRRTSKEKTCIQKTLFEEKKSLIENSLFGVDINPNSVSICRLRLWIELLKNSYYHEDGNLETLPNIDINIKCGNSLISRYSLTDDIKTKNIKATIDEYKERITDYKENIGDKIAIQGAIDRLKEQFKLTLKAGYKHRQTLKEKLKLYVY